MSSQPAFHSVPPRSAVPDDVLVRGLIADELDRIRVVLEDMGVQLCCDPEIVRSHMGALQTLDELCQRNENLARTLRASDMAAETALISLESLRTRMQSALADYRANDDSDPRGEWVSF
jgi:hypothetical protein